MNKRGHQWIDQRSLAFGCAVADKLEAEPTLLDLARKNLEIWIHDHADAPHRAHLEWRDILEQKSLPEILSLLRSDTEEARRLRQSSPFAGLLSPQERWRILNDYESQPA